MGNLCGKSSSSSSLDAFAQPGRTLGSAPPPQQDAESRTPIPSRATKPSGPGRTVGGTGESGGGAQTEAREQAARAAEARAKPQTKTQGQLSQKLAEQKRQTDNQALQQASRDERGFREADRGAERRAYN